MKFLIIASYLESVINFRGKLIDKLHSAGIKVYVICPYDSEKSKIYLRLIKKKVSIYNINISNTSTNPFLDAIYLYRLFNLIKNINPHYVLPYTIKPVIYGLISCKLAGITNVYPMVTGLGYSFTGKPKGMRLLIQFITKVLYKFAFRFSKAVFFQNKDDKQLFKKLRILKTNHRIVVINGSGVDLKYFSFEDLPNEISFLMLSRLVGDKGVREYVQAAKNIRLKFKSIKFYLAGWTDMNPDAITKKELDKWIREKTITFFEKVDDVRPLIKKCSVYVLPSYREGLPRSVCEAMSMGRPIITTDAPGCRETTITNKNGYLVPVKSVEPLEIAMMNFIKKPDLCLKMGKFSRRLAEKKFDVNVINSIILKEMNIKC